MLSGPSKSEGLFSKREAFQLVDQIARNQVFGQGDRLVIGNYTDQQTGYIGAARSEGGVYYNSNPAVYNALKAAFGKDAGEVSWLINQRVLELYAYDKPPEFLNQGLSADDLPKELSAAKDVWKDSTGTIDDYPNARFWEIRWLRAQGFQLEPILDAAGKVRGYRFVPPKVSP